jgi:hypothetical protein
MHTTRLLACAGLAIAAPAAAQTQNFLMVPNNPNGIVLFDPQNGAVVTQSFIPRTGPAWDHGISVLKSAVQVDDEIWISVQASHTIWRFDLNGKYYGKITDNVRNVRGMHYHNGIVYVVNFLATGALSGPGIHKFSPAGDYLGGFEAGTGPWDLTIVGSIAFITDGTANNILHFNIDGTDLGVFHAGAMETPQQIVTRANGNFLVGGSSGTTGIRGIYEIDPTGAQVQYLSTLSAGVVGVAELANGNFLYSSSSNIHLFNTSTSTSSVVVSGGSQFINPLTVNTSAVGACCYLDGTCDIQSIADCGNAEGIFRGDGTACATAACPPVGACCFPDASCTILPVDYCEIDTGIWNGAGSTCAATQCSFRLITLRPTLSSSQAGSGIFFDLTPNQDITVSQIDFMPAVSAGTPITVDVYIRDGTYIGFDMFPAEWDTHYTIHTTSLGNLSTSALTAIELPSPLGIAAHQTAGIYIVGTVGGYRYRSSTTQNPVNDDTLTLFSDLARTEPFGGSASTRRFAGSIHYIHGSPTPACYANCDGSTTEPILNVEDFTCFINEFAQAQALPHPQQVTHYANCDNSTTEPALNVEDFICFIDQFAQGCP